MARVNDHIIRLGFGLSRFIRPAYNFLPSSLRSRISGLVRERSVATLKSHDLAKLQDPALAQGKIGVNLIGFPFSTSGLGNLLKRAHQAMAASALPHGVVDIQKTSFQAQHEKDASLPILSSPEFKGNIFCLNGDGLLTTLSGVPEDFWQKRFNIQYAAWELPSYPIPWRIADRFIHEYWAISEYTAESIRRTSSVPCLNMGIPVAVDIQGKYERSTFNLPEHSFLFLTAFDMNSVTYRKNPDGAIAALQKAFPQSKKDDVGLVVKVSRIRGRNEQDKMFRNLTTLANKDPRIKIIDQVLSRDQMNGLMNLCDGFLSLHRSEGFGLGMAEAMCLGKTVVATGYSGNMGFMREDNSYLVQFKEVPVVEGGYPYWQGQTWAEPDEESAVASLRLAFLSENKEMGERAKKFIEEEFSIEAFAKKYRQRLSDLNII